MINKEFYKGKDISYEYDGQTQEISLTMKEGKKEKTIFKTKSVKELKLIHVLNFYKDAIEWINNEETEMDKSHMYTSKYTKQYQQDIYENFMQWSLQEVERK